MYLRAVGRLFTQMNAYFLVMNSKRCSTSKMFARFSLKWIRSTLVRLDFLKSIRPMTNNTLQHRLLKMPFSLDSISAISKIGWAFWTILEIWTIAMSILNKFCLHSTLQNVADPHAVTVTFTLIPFFPLRSPAEKANRNENTFQGHPTTVSS